MKILIFTFILCLPLFSHAASISPCKDDPSTSREIGEYYPEQILDLTDSNGEVVGAITVNSVFYDIDGLILCGDNPNFFFGSGGSLEVIWELKSLDGLLGLNRNTMYDEAYVIAGGSSDGKYRGSSMYFDFNLTISPRNGRSFKRFSTGDLTLKINRNFLPRQ